MNSLKVGIEKTVTLIMKFWVVKVLPILVISIDICSKETGCVAVGYVRELCSRVWLHLKSENFTLA